MKHLYEYAINRIIEKRNNNSNDISNDKLKKIHNFLKTTLAEKNTLAEYVDQLNDMLKDKDSKQILVKAFGNAEHGYDFDGSIKNLSVKDLHPTQSEIDIDKSLGFPFKSVELAKLNGERYYGDKPVSMPFPLITFDGKYILDGHHRWSQVFAFNKDAKMVCLDITLSSDSDIKKISPTDALKICQGVLAAKRATDNKGNLPKSTVDGLNVFDMNKQAIINKVKEYIQKDDGKPAEELAKCAKLNSVNEFVNLLTDNLMELKKDNKTYSDKAKAKGNSRDVMPQTDRGGDDPEDQETAKPDKKGSALNKMLNGKTSSTVLKQ